MREKRCGQETALLRSRGGAILALLLSAASLLPGAARAEGLGGFVDLGYSEGSAVSSDTAGNTSRSDTNSTTQRYNLNFSRNLFPYLRLSASGLFDKIDSTSTTNGAKTDSTTTRVQPFVDLTMRNPLYTAGTRYSRREETTSSSGAPSVTTINEIYGGVLGWRPEDFPSAELRLERSNLFDRQRVSQDTTRDLAALIMEYSPSNDLTVNYRPSYIVTNDRLNSFETRNQSQVGRVDYGTRFFDNRVSIGTSYNISYNELRTSISGTGSVDIRQVPFSGLSSIDDTPADGALATNGALIDDNLTASAGIDIGLPPIGGDTGERNMGLDFFIEKGVNTLRVWVDRELPASIAGSFSWTVYTSADNLTWNAVATVFPASFGPFENFFELTFPQVTARFIKVAVRPLSPAVNGAAAFPDIFVTELQAFTRESAEKVRGKSTSSNQIVNFDGKVLLLTDSPTLYYSTSYFLATAEPAHEQRWTLTNALTATHRFNRVLSGSARAGREDFSDPTEAGIAYVANTSLDAAPIHTLHHTLTYSGRFEDREVSGRTRTNSVFLNNRAELYRGVDVTVSGGVSASVQPSGQHVRSTDLSASTSLVPHPTLNLNFFFSSTESEATGGDKPASTTRTTRTDTGATWSPFQSLYLVAGLSTVSDQQRTRRLQNYALNWSPFLGGSLQFALAYNESLASESNAKVRVIGPTVAWKITRATSLTAAYQVTRSTSDDGKSDSKLFSTNLRAYF